MGDIFDNAHFLRGREGESKRARETIKDNFCSPKANKKQLAMFVCIETKYLVQIVSYSSLFLEKDTDLAPFLFTKTTTTKCPLRFFQKVGVLIFLIFIYI